MADGLEQKDEADVYDIYEWNGLKIAVQKEDIDFKKIQHGGHPISTFSAVSDKNGDFLIIYDYEDEVTRSVETDLEAFYIENINDSNRDLAMQLITTVYETIANDFSDNHTQSYPIAEKVKAIIEEKKNAQGFGFH